MPFTFAPTGRDSNLPRHPLAAMGGSVAIVRSAVRRLIVRIALNHARFARFLIDA